MTPLPQHRWVPSGPQDSIPRYSDWWASHLYGLVNFWSANISSTHLETWKHADSGRVLDLKEFVQVWAKELKEMRTKKKTWKGTLGSMLKASQVNTLLQWPTTFFMFTDNPRKIGLRLLNKELGWLLWEHSMHVTLEKKSFTPRCQSSRSFLRIIKEKIIII